MTRFALDVLGVMRVTTLDASLDAMAALTAPSLAPLVADVGWWLVHALWQGTIVALLLGVALRVIHPRAATLRYGLSVLALIAIVVWPVYTTAKRAPALTATTTVTATTARPTPATATTTTTATATATTMIIGRDAAAGGADTIGAWIAMRVTLPLIRGIDASVSWLVPIWLIGVLLLTVRTFGSWIAARRLIARDVGPLPAVLVQRVAELKRRLGVTRPVTLLQSFRADVPAVMGYLRPVLLLPVSALSGLTPQQLDAIIVHELAHVRRHDYLLNICQHVVEIALFFHPAVWWVSNRIRQEREHCCDDLAVLICGDALTYSAALLALEEQRGERPMTRLAMAATHGRLVDRVARLLGRADRRPATWTLAAPLTVVAAAGLALTTLAAQGVPPSVTPSVAPPRVEQPVEQPPPVEEPQSPATVEHAAAAAARRDLVALIDAAPDRRARAQGISYLSGDLSAEAWLALVTIAETHADHETRKIAISYISGRADAQAFDTLRALYDRAPTRDLKRHVISYISGWLSSPTFGPSARATLRAIATGDADDALRQAAVWRLAGQ